MKVDLTTDIRIIALTSAALRLENVVTEGHLTDPLLIEQTEGLARQLRREINILKLKSPNPEPQNS